MQSPAHRSMKFPAGACMSLAIILLAACSERPAPPAASTPAPATKQTVVDTRPLRALAEFPVGVAVPADPWPHSLLGSPERQAIVRRHFDSLTAENAMKMKYLQPGRREFTFQHADALVAWALDNGLAVHGHTLVWHNQAPDWMNELDGPPATFEEALTTHVRTVAEHFAGKVTSWDVVNEAFTDESPIEYRDTIWYRNLGADYLELAFRQARAAAPAADLYYNDYDISGTIGPDKLDRILVMADDFLARGVPIDGIGFQMHVDTESPGIDAIRSAFAKVAARGLKVKITELDVSVNQEERLTELDRATAALQRHRYSDIVRSYVETVPAELRAGITVWGITDGDSWIPAFRDRADWPLLFNADFEPKPALAGFAEGLGAGD
jgi:endo-1,4-beta-xylanase